MIIYKVVIRQLSVYFRSTLNNRNKLVTSGASVFAIALAAMGIMYTASAQMTPSSMTQSQNATAAAVYDLTSSNKTFYIFNQEVEGLNENMTGIPGDIYSQPVIVVNKGDTVTVHMYNTEDDANDRHSFTLGGSYKVDIDVAGGQNGNATFTADREGVFIFYCKYHLPTMQGELVVLPGNSTAGP